MRWFVRTAVAAALSALAVVALTWAGWPGPRSVVTLPLGKAAGLVYFQRLSWGEAAPWRLIAGFSPVPQLAYTFLHEDGRVVGPWLPATDIKVYGFDRDRRLLAAVNTPGDVLAGERTLPRATRPDEDDQTQRGQANRHAGGPSGLVWGANRSLREV